MSVDQGKGGCVGRNGGGVDGGGGGLLGLVGWVSAALPKLVLMCWCTTRQQHTVQVTHCADNV